jgi:hypothetical protein
MYCTNCGSKMWEGARFCADCGTARAVSKEGLATRRVETGSVERERQRVSSATRTTLQASAAGSKSTYTTVSSVVNELEDDDWHQRSTDCQNWYRRYVAPAVADILRPADVLHRNRHLRLLASGLFAIITSFFLFGSLPILGFLLLVVGIATVAVTKFEIEWSGVELPVQERVITVPGITLVVGVLVVGYMFGLLI